MTWIIILGLFFLLFQQQLTERYNPNHKLSALQLTPADPVVLNRNSKGHYVAPGLINGSKVTFLLDTGATDISIPASIARQLGLNKGRPMQAYTANGVITVYETTLDAVSLGGITLLNIPASINPHMGGDTALLGMSFMQHLEMIQRGDTLTLKQMP
ncbi:retropepsin-like aspartic protease family protein [Amphritea sp. HPY]|uniref:retropepsin-like aspartic protease family protein n=1 Tax=Amphritea sp. HPY TaxID=3421652 RepID=UPI003D7D9663